MPLKVIAGKYKGRNLKTLPGYQTRPLLARPKKSLFDILTPRIINSVFLDLFAGSGSVGIEALSRGAKKAVFVESDRKCVRIIEENLRSLSAENSAEVIQSNASDPVFLNQKFDIIFVGPPYKMKILPDIIEKLGGVAVKGGLVITQNHYKDILPEKIGIFSISRKEKYGDMVLTFYVSG
ncbi:MAG: 16S rRNA (guanine(966)-N(2))-methyltransferase RsmD [Elusimicrobia bacterium]|nr:16S rRNA (guanine(966)-N(2))-methyltransferase RsmD [Elusimicrobiota bacterium]